MSEGHQYQIIGTPAFSEIAENVQKKIAEQYGAKNVALGKISIGEFPNGENNIKIESNVRDSDVFLFHSMQLPDPDKAFVTAILTIDALKQADAKSVTLVLPYMSYLRQDRREDGRTPISGEVVSRLISADPLVRRVVTIDMHCHQAEGFFSKPVEHIPGTIFFRDYIKDLFKGDFSNVEVVSPDYGSAKRVEKFAKSLDSTLNANVYGKKRTKDGTVTAHYVGESLVGKSVILYDDQIDTGGTILGAAKKTMEAGAKEVYICSPHGLFTTKKGDAISCEQKFAESGVKVITTNTIPKDQAYYDKNASWLTVIPIEEKLSDIMYALSTLNGSVSQRVNAWLK
jgi:ribose-phosphate pyrophosphokinase